MQSKRLRWSWAWGFLVAAGILSAGCASTTEGFPALRPGVLNQTAALEIATGERAEIGPASAPFSLQIQNRGKVPVLFVVRDRGGEERGQETLEPGSFLQPRVPEGSVAVLSHRGRLRGAALIVRVDAAQAVPVRTVVND